MERDDETGEPIFPEAVVIPPRLRDARLIVGFAAQRVENGTMRGLPAVELLLNTTEGDFTFLLSRADMSRLANGLTEVLCDG